MSTASQVWGLIGQIQDVEVIFLICTVTSFKGHLNFAPPRTSLLSLDKDKLRQNPVIR